MHGTCVVNLAAKTATNSPIISLKHGNTKDPSIDGVIQCLQDVLQHYENLKPEDNGRKPRAVVNCSFFISTGVIYTDSEKTTKKIEELVKCVQKLHSARIPLVAAAGNRDSIVSQISIVEGMKRADMIPDRNYLYRLALGTIQRMVGTGTKRTRQPLRVRKAADLASSLYR
jgi:hypothetical protein